MPFVLSPADSSRRSWRGDFRLVIVDESTVVSRSGSIAVSEITCSALEDDGVDTGVMGLLILGVDSSCLNNSLRQRLLLAIIPRKLLKN